MTDRRPEHFVDQGMFVRARRGRSRGTLVCVHGLGESGLCFERLFDLEPLDAWNLLVCDLPGYGRSAWRDSTLALEDQADLLAGWIRERAPAAPRVVVGHSMGGVVGVLLAERHPDALDLLLNVDGNLSPGDCVFSGRAVEWSAAAFERGGFDRLRDTVYRQGSRERAQRGYYASLCLADPRQYHRNSGELVAISADEGLAARMAALAVPAHYVAGVPRGASPRSRELLDTNGLSWTAIEPAGHWPFLDRPEDFARALLDAIALHT